MNEPQPPVVDEAAAQAQLLRRWQRASDAIFLLGAALIFGGIGLIHVPSAMVALGASLVFLAAKRERRQ